MEVEATNNATIKAGWIRALLLVILYVSTSVAAGLFARSMEVWISLSFICAVVSVYIFRRYIDRKSVESLGTRLADFFPHALTGVFLGLFLVSAGTLAIFFAGGVDWIDIAPDTEDLLLSGMLMLMVAVAEELVFRGYFLTNMLQSMNRWLALLLSAVLFTLVHAGNPDIPLLGYANTFSGGLLLGITYMHARVLWAPVGFHFGWNFMHGPVYGFNVSGIDFRSVLVPAIKNDDIITGGTYGFEGSIFAGILLLIGFAVWCIMYLRGGVLQQKMGK